MSESWRDQTVTWGRIADRLGIVDPEKCSRRNVEHGPHLVATSSHELQVCPGKTWTDIRVRPLTRDELESLLDEKLQNWQWERIQEHVQNVHHREAR